MHIFLLEISHVLDLFQNLLRELCLPLKKSLYKVAHCHSISTSKEPLNELFGWDVPAMIGIDVLNAIFDVCFFDVNFEVAEDLSYLLNFKIAALIFIKDIEYFGYLLNVMQILLFDMLLCIFVLGVVIVIEAPFAFPLNKLLCISINISSGHHYDLNCVYRQLLHHIMGESLLWRIWFT